MARHYAFITPYNALQAVLPFAIHIAAWRLVLPLLSLITRHERYIALCRTTPRLALVILWSDIAPALFLLRSDAARRFILLWYRTAFRFASAMPYGTVRRQPFFLPFPCAPDKNRKVRTAVFLGPPKEARGKAKSGLHQFIFLPQKEEAERTTAYRLSFLPSPSLMRGRGRGGGE